MPLSFGLGKGQFSLAGIQPSNTPVQSVVASDMALHFDGVNSSSNTGAGSIWYNLAAANNATFNVAPTRSTDGNGSFAVTSGTLYATIPTQSTPDPTSLAVGLGDFSLNLWFKMGSLGATQIIISKFATWTSSFDWAVRFIGSTKSVTVLVGNNAPLQINSGSNTITSTNIWYNLTLVRTSGVTKLYINNEEKASSSTSASIPGSGTAIFMGVDQDFTEPMVNTGKIAHVGFYKKALSEAERLQNYNALRSRYEFNVLSGASAAYSLRQLTFSYTGAVIRVRRSNDNTESDFTIAELTNGTLATWVGASNDGFVTRWYDQSGNNNHLFQNTTTAQPRIVSAGVLITDGGKPAVRFATDGNHTFSLTTRLYNVHGTVSVWRPESYSSLTFMFGDTVGAAGGYSANAYYHPGHPNLRWLATGLPSEIVNGTNKINGVVTNLTATAPTTNRVLLTMAHTSGTATISSLSKDRSNDGRSWRGYVQEILLFSTNKASSMSDIESTINTHYSIY